MIPLLGLRSRRNRQSDDKVLSLARSSVADHKPLVLTVVIFCPMHLVGKTLKTSQHGQFLGHRSALGARRFGQPDSLNSLPIHAIRHAP